MPNVIKAIQITEQEGRQTIRQPSLAFLSVFSKQGDMFLLVETPQTGGPIKNTPILKVLNDNAYAPTETLADGTSYALSYIGSTSPDDVNAWHVFFETEIPPLPVDPEPFGG